MTAAVAETALTVVPREAPAELTVEQIVAQAQKIQLVMEKVMKDGEHYGVIPGTGKRVGADGKELPPKPTLLKPGAEKLCLLFRLDPQYDIKTAVERPDLIRFTVCCTLYHIPTGMRCASGLGSCNSSEDKYLRPADKKCPTCGKTAIKRSKFPPKGQPSAEPGWYCFAKVGGCGANFDADDKGVTEQDVGVKDPADLHNTILKMACKRALIAAVLNATAASDFFTQDLDDLNAHAAEYLPPAPDLKAQLEKSVKEGSAPKAPTGAPPAEPPTTPAAAAPTTSTTDTGEAATAEQKEAIRVHIRTVLKWKRQFALLWFKQVFGFEGGDPVEALSQQQADAAGALLIAHGTKHYRALRMEFAGRGLVLKDEDDIQW